MLKSVNRLKKRKEFAYLYNNGQAVHLKHITLVYLPTKNRPLKIGFSVAKKIGKAHTRNLVKRRMRSIVRNYTSSMLNNYNVVFICKTGIDEISFTEMENQIKTLINKAGLIRNV